MHSKILVECLVALALVMLLGRLLWRARKRSGFRPRIFPAGAAAAALILVLAFLVQGLRAQQVFLTPILISTKVFSAAGTAWGGTNNWAVIPGIGDKQAIIRTLEVTSDSAPGRVVVFTNGFECVSSNPVLGGTNIQLASGTASGGTNGFAAMDPILIDGYSGTTRVLMLAQVHAVGTTNVSTRQSITNLDAGARIYRLGTNAIFTGVSNGPTSLRGGQFIAVGAKGQSTAVQITAPAACNLNSVGGTYEPVQEPK